MGWYLIAICLVVGNTLEISNFKLQLNYNILIKKTKNVVQYKYKKSRRRK